MNRLQYEKSPYLLQHKKNPVNWYPWSDKAFERAKKEDKLIFLSIGYSTCHWCHVMEKESFEDDEVATLLNNFFISIKVDREERPDIDHVYMQAAHLMRQQGGWPLTVLMSHTKRPFFIATYIPKYSSGHHSGLLQLLPYMYDIWNNKRDDISNVENQMSELLNTLEDQDNCGEADFSLITQSIKELSEKFDSKNGGFSSSPKFPTPHIMIFLLRQSLHTKNSNQLQQMVQKTLDHLSMGGIYDHIGYGFHRYSTDERWLLPHFEKMLYDQAMLTLVYVEYFAITKDTTFSEIPKQIIKYVIRDLKSEKGGFFCAEDADSEGEEGKFYVWNYKELKEILNKDELLFVEKMYGIKQDGNYLEEGNKKLSFNNIFHLTTSRVKKKTSFTDEDNKTKDDFNIIREKLFLKREERVRPHKDDKILTDWNGLMIVALAKAGSILNEISYLEEAKSAMNFILNHMRTANKELFHFHCHGTSSINGYIDDYSHIIWALIELYEVTFDVSYLEEAIKLTDTMINLFWDEKMGAFFFTSNKSEKFILRNKEWYDGALPSGNSIACYSLGRLFDLIGDHNYKNLALQLVNSGDKIFKGSPSSYSFMMLSLDYLLKNRTQIVIISKNLRSAQKGISKFKKKYDPFQSLVVIEEKNRVRYASIAEFTKDMKMLEGKTTVYICKDFLCQKPIVL